jgi:hypothetical protein
MASAILEPAAAEPVAGRGAAETARLAAPAAAVLSMVAAWVHFAYMTSHWEDWWAYGVFFLVMGIGQGLFAALILYRQSPWLLVAGIVGNLAIIGMYVWSRTWGVPLGPHIGVVEHAKVIDLAITAAEIVLVGVLLAMAGSGLRRAVINTLLVAGVVLWVLRLTGHLP